MAIFDIFKKKGAITGEIVLRGLPSHKSYSASVTFFPVASATSPAPFNGDPPVHAWTDTESVKEESEPDDKPLRFRFQRSSGFYFLGISVIAYLERGGKMFAQVERFFPMTQPSRVQAGIEKRAELVVNWPDIPFDELQTYGTIHPNKN